LQEADVSQSLRNITNLEWLPSAERRALKSLQSVEKKIRYVNQQLLRDSGSLKLSEQLEQLSSDLRTAGHAARKYLPHRSPAVVELATKILHMHKEASNQILVMWSSVPGDESDASAPLEYDIGTYLSFNLVL
jgi:hypothetical protein